MSTRLRKGDKVQLRIAALAGGGEGISKDLGIPVFVGRTAPGDLIEAELFDVRKDFAKAHMIKLIEPSAQRAEPACKLFKVCGGCQWQHLGYADQLGAKTDIVRNALKHIGGLSSDMVRDTMPAGDPLFYRNKVQFPVQRQSSGRIIAGYYKEGSHELVNIKHCPIQPEALDRMLAVSKEALEEHGIDAYDESSGKGLIRHIVARFSFAHGEMIVTFVINSGKPPRANISAKLEKVAAALMKTVPEIIGVSVNLNPQAGNRIMGDTTYALAGASFIEEVLISEFERAPDRLKEGVSFRLSPMSFFQVNSRQAVVLLDQMLRAVTEGEDESAKIPLIIDAYAGVGTMALWLSPVAEKIIAIESVAPAVEDGEVNAQLNGVNNIDFNLGQVEKVAPLLVAQGLHPDIVVVDPPRKGVDKMALEAICRMAPRKIVYVSCNPATLARDLKLATSWGYGVEYVQPIDMFPQTHHVESVSLLVRQ